MLTPGRRFILLLVTLLAAAAPAMAAGLGGQVGDKERYEDCLRLAGRDPAAALGTASQWSQQHGGAPAQHCAAIALVGLKRYAEAGAGLDALGRAPDVGALRPSLLDQAGNAWLLAGDAAHAMASFQAALTLSANDPDLYADLARAEALRKNWGGVEADLNAALAIAPKRPDLLVLRASARHAMGKLDAARADANAALALKANDPGALLERGSIARDSGDLTSARGDFENIVKQGTPGEIGDSALGLLAAMDAAAKAKPASPKPAAPAKKSPAIPPAR